MVLQTSSWTLPETRFFKAGTFIFRFKFRAGMSFSREKMMEDNGFNQEMEDIVRTVLGNLDNLQPFYTNKYIIFPYKKRWHGCKCNVKVYPFTVILNVEKKQENSSEEREKTAQDTTSVSDEPLAKRRRRDSPLEEAILQELIQDMEAKHTVKVDVSEQHGKASTEEPHAEEETQDTEQLEGTSMRPGILQRMARRFFPFFFKNV